MLHIVEIPVDTHASVDHVDDGIRVSAPDDRHLVAVVLEHCKSRRKEYPSNAIYLKVCRHGEEVVPYLVNLIDINLPSVLVLIIAEATPRNRRRRGITLPDMVLDRSEMTDAKT